MNARLPVVEVISDDMVDVLRRKTEAERIKIGSQMWQSARVIIKGSISYDYPDWNSEQIDREIAKRISHGLVSHVKE